MVERESDDRSWMDRYGRCEKGSRGHAMSGGGVEEGWTRGVEKVGRVGKGEGGWVGERRPKGAAGEEKTERGARSKK